MLCRLTMSSSIRTLKNALRLYSETLKSIDYNRESISILKCSKIMITHHRNVILKFSNYILERCGRINIYVYSDGISYMGVTRFFLKQFYSINQVILDNTI